MDSKPLLKIDFNDIYTPEERALIRERELARMSFERLVGPPINSRRGVEFYTGETYGDR